MSSGTPITFAFLGQGKLMLVRPGQAPVELASAFVERIEALRERDRDRHAWQGDGMAWAITRRSPIGGMMPQMQMMAPGAAAARFVSVAAGGAPGQLFYSIHTAYVGGLFEYQIRSGEERRLVHKANLHAEGIMADPVSGDLAFCARNDDGSASIAMADRNGSKIRVLTEGDSVDECPSWSSANPRTIVFQSAGIGRDQNGAPVEFTSYRIETLDMETQKMTVLAEDGRFDYLSPRVAADGTLYCIRRPYESRGPRVSAWSVLKQIVLFPVGVVMTIVAIFNTLSLFLRQKPLLTGGAQRDMGGHMRNVLLWGRWVDAKKAVADEKSEQSLVPADWVLVRRSSDGAETEVASRVVHFDLCDTGVLYTNGSRVWHLDNAGTRTELVRGKLIERLAVVQDAPAPSPTGDPAP